jgi:hypothetical protein
MDSLLLNGRYTTDEAELRRIKKNLRTGDFRHVAIHAKVVLEFCPDYHNV